MIYEYNEDLHPYELWPKGIGSVSAIRAMDQCSIDIPVMYDHMLVVGKSGYGKTTFTQEYVKQLLKDREEPFTVFFDIKRDFRSVFMRERDKVVSYSPKICKDTNLFKWNMVKEIKQSMDWDAELKELSGIMFADLENDNRNMIWINGARQVFEGYLKTVLYCTRGEVSNGQLFREMGSSSIKAFIEHLAHYKGNVGILRDYFDYEKGKEKYVIPRKASDIMLILRGVIDRFGGAFALDEGDDTLHDFFHGRYGKRLFLAYDYQKRDASSMLFSYFLKKIVDERLSQDVDMSKRVLMVLDEVTELGVDFGLMPAVTIGRGNRLQVILATQSIEKLYGIGPVRNNEHYTNAVLAGFPTLVAFTLGEPKSIESIQQLFGKRQRLSYVVPLSRYEQTTHTISEQPLVSDRDFATLGVGECYIKIRNADPDRVRILLET